jgi:hypothetical protein
VTGGKFWELPSALAGPGHEGQGHLGSGYSVRSCLLAWSSTKFLRALSPLARAERSSATPCRWTVRVVAGLVELKEAVLALTVPVLDQPDRGAGLGGLGAEPAGGATRYELPAGGDGGSGDEARHVHGPDITSGPGRTLRRVPGPKIAPGSGSHRVAHGADEDLWAEFDVVVQADQVPGHVDDIADPEEVEGGLRRGRPRPSRCRRSRGR